MNSSALIQRITFLFTCIMLLFTLSKRRLATLATIAITLAIACLPTPRIYLSGASVSHIKSGSWVVSGPWFRMTDFRFRWLVNAINAHGNISCMRISKPKMTDAGFAPVTKLKSLKWLFIEDSSIGDEALDYLHRMDNLTKLYFDRCPNLSEAKIAWLREQLPKCKIRINAYSF